MSTLPYHIHNELAAAIDAAGVNLEAIRAILSGIGQEPEAPPPPPGYTLHPGQDPAVALADLRAGDNLWLVDGIHPYPIHLPAAINVRAADGADPVVSGWARMDWTRYSTDSDRVVYRLPWDRRTFGLSHHIVTNTHFLAAQDGPDRMAAHNFATQPELVRYNDEPLARYPVSQVAAGVLRQGYDEKTGYLYISLPAGADLERLEVARYPQLFTAADGVAGITVSGITLTGAAGTHKQGAFELHSDGNVIDVTVDLVNSLAFSVRGIGLDARMVSSQAGQMGHWIKCQKSKLVIEHYESNFRGSDAGWHASNKFEQSLDNDIAIVAGDCDGVGAWFDVGNHNNRVKLSLYGSRKNALLVEHYAEGNTFSGVIRDTQPLGRWTGADIQIQSNVKGNVFDGLDIQGTEVPYWLVYKTVEGRGPSGPNTFRNISAYGRPYRIEGGRHEKDVFDAIV
jgi:hypothetical protein